ncbi:seed maturation protein [Thalictrum thalictroides]|uniref:Seed maturation protein n=1 Tax=Thalictrum thalictroides TaxID=46969 RepID=A0A7J6V2N0_THATH|nr:seed maturation protein [Thalictrum thalictroides]KAF5181033.1 seed maturation protein [Thalictrum thalictroides]
MAKSKEDIKYGTAQAKLSEDETLRVAYEHGTPIEAGKIADSEPIDLLASAHNISKAKSSDDSSNQAQLNRSGGDDNDSDLVGATTNNSTSDPSVLPKKATN